ncbi:winged helix-turn-helix domain-containing protein [Rhodobacter ferrooxidans]|uniref:Transcriptional regulator, CadC n=1 Tax=Rhodobacter ferrooxidans TaxID=371731 RepID=C8S437_9RHOB|nr:winged helix-turn-helix domain-containing protein [Rhodobacter sp. SW2]EEW24299.1 transcriptional regulator, CadC [Rhodobacter sp. SW2]
MDAGTFVVQFAEVTLDMGRGRLIGRDGDVALRRKSFVLLCYMTQHAGQVLTKERLMSAVWPEVTVSDDSLTQCVHDVRRALGGSGASELRTVQGRGYLLVLPNQGGNRPIAAPTNGMVPTQLRPGSVAVLPFAYDPAVLPDERIWLDGVVNDVISQLVRLRSLDVIGRDSAFALRDVSGLQAGVTLGVAYVLAGSVFRADRDVVLRVDLVATRSQSIVWTDEFRTTGLEIAGLITVLTDRILSVVLNGIDWSERNLARAVPDHALTAWQAYFRGLDAFAQYGEEPLLRARHYFALATRIDPSFVSAFAALAECQATIARAPFCQDQPAERAAAQRSAEQALHLDETAPAAHFAFAHTRWLLGDVDAAFRHARRSVELGPGYATGVAEVGFLAALNGPPDEALHNLARAELLNPVSPFLSSLYIDRATAHLQRGELEQAAHWAQIAAARPGGYALLWVACAILLAASGKVDAANRIVATLRKDNAPHDWMRFFNPPFNVQGPARHRMLDALAVLDL